MKRVDWLIAGGLATLYVIVLVKTAPSLGYARDEGFYFRAAESYARWIELLWTQPRAAMLRSNIDAAFSLNHEHPALAKGLFALSWTVLYKKLHLFSEEGTSFRFPGMCFAGLAIATIYAWGRQVYSRLVGLSAALFFALVPTTFYHAHLDCFDVPITAMWLLTAYCYWRSCTSGGTAWALMTGVIYGLTLDTKHNSWFLPVAVLVHAVFTRQDALDEDVKIGWFRIPLAFFTMLMVGPVVFVLMWPWLWFDTYRRFADYAAFHLNHDYYNIELFGVTYWRPPFPHSWAWVMTAATVPAVTLALFVLGLAIVGKRELWGDLARLIPRLQRWTSTGLPHPADLTPPAPSPPAAQSALGGEGVPDDVDGRDDGAALAPAQPNLPATHVGPGTPSPAKAHLGRRLERGPGGEVGRREVSLVTPSLVRSAPLLWLIGVGINYGPWALSGTPIFGGTKHWMAAYPFMMLFAGVGVAWVVTTLREWGATSEREVVAKWLKYPVIEALVVIAVMVAPMVETLRSHPWGLTGYVPTVGGAVGAANLGLNRSFWGYSTGSVVDVLNAKVRPGGSVYIHDTAWESWKMLQRDGRLRADLRPSGTPAGADAALYHHEQHMAGVEYQIWEALGTTTPAVVRGLDGVPIVWVYLREGRANHEPQ